MCKTTCPVGLDVTLLAREPAVPARFKLERTDQLLHKETHALTSHHITFTHIHRRQPTLCLLIQNCKRRSYLFLPSTAASHPHHFFVIPLPFSILSFLLLSIYASLSLSHERPPHLWRSPYRSRRFHDLLEFFPILPDVQDVDLSVVGTQQWRNCEAVTTRWAVVMGSAATRRRAIRARWTRSGSRRARLRTSSTPFRSH